MQGDEIILIAAEVSRLYQAKRSFCVFPQSLVLSGLQNPASLSVFEQYIYWVDWKTNSILRANKTDGSSRQTIKRNISMARSLKVVHKDIQKGE